MLAGGELPLATFARSVQACRLTLSSSGDVLMLERPDGSTLVLDWSTGLAIDGSPQPSFPGVLPEIAVESRSP